MIDTEANGRAALLRIRVLRSSGYRCGHKARPSAPICGAPASLVGSRPADDEIVALCLAHAVE